MPLSISDWQLNLDKKDAISVPLLFKSHLLVQHHMFSANEEFSSLIYDVFELKNTGSKNEEYPLLPSGCMLMIFEMKPHQPIKCLLCGALTTMRKMHVSGGTTIFCVRLRSDSADWLVGKRASLLTNHAAYLNVYLMGADALLQKMCRCESFGDRMVLLKCHLADIGAKDYLPVALLQRCISLIHENHGLLRVNVMADMVGCSVRYISHVFQDRVGVSAKMYSEMTQLHYSLYGILKTQPKSLLNVALTYGYFDQAHMNRFYRKFLKYTASDMRYVDIRTIYADDVPDIP